MLEFLPAVVAQTTPTPGGSAGYLNIVMLLVMFAVIYFLMIRPQQKQAKQHREYVASLKKGDDVVTSAGIYGKIDAVEDGVVRLEIARDVKIRVQKSQIAGPQPGAAAPGEGSNWTKKD